jgi:hypothetical protein
VAARADLVQVAFLVPGELQLTQLELIQAGEGPLDEVLDLFRRTAGGREGHDRAGQLDEVSA